MTNSHDSLLALPTDALGGAERVLQSIALHLAQSRRVVHVIFLSKPNRNTWSGLPHNVRLHHILANTEKEGVASATRLVARLSRSSRFSEAISSHTHVNAWLGALRTSRILRCDRLIVRESTIMTARFRGLKLAAIRALYYIGYWSTDLIICQTNEMQRELVRFVPAASAWNTAVIPNPFDKSRVKSIRSEPSPDDDYPQIIAAGRLIPEKGFDTLIHAFTLLAGNDPVLRLGIMGVGLEEPRLRDIVPMDLRAHVIFLGHQTDPFPYFRNAQIGVVSSRVEGFPNVLLEMMATCPRVVSTRCADGIEHIDGIGVCSPADPPALARTIARELARPAWETRERRLAELEARTPRAFWSAVERALQT